MKACTLGIHVLNGGGESYGGDHQQDFEFHLIGFWLILVFYGALWMACQFIRPAGIGTSSYAYSLF